MGKLDLQCAEQPASVTRCMGRPLPYMLLGWCDDGLDILVTWQSVGRC